MMIPNFNNQAMQWANFGSNVGQNFGSALRNAQAMQQQQQAIQQKQAFDSQMNPLLLEQANLRNEGLRAGIEQDAQNSQMLQNDELRKQLVQDAVMLANYDEETGKKAIVEMIDKYKSNPAVVQGLTSLFEKKGTEYTKGTLMTLAALTGKGLGEKKELPAETVGFNDLIKDMTPEQQKTAKLIKAGLKGRAVSSAVLSAIESGDVQNLADAKAKIKEAEKFADATGASRAKIIDSGFDKIQKINTGLSNIDAAIQAVDEGAGVGAIEKNFPSLKAATVTLNNIQGLMTLDVLNAATFGALSEGELELAKQIALPTGLNNAELKEHLVKKKAAQEKLRAYFEEQIEFLDQGGTVGGFLRMKKAGSKSENPKVSGQNEDVPDLTNLSLEELKALRSQF